MHDDAYPTRRGMKLRWRLLFSAALFGPAILVAIDGDYVAAGVLAVIGISAFLGYRTGAIGILAFLVFGLPAALFAVHTYYLPLDLIYDRFADKIGGML